MDSGKKPSPRGSAGPQPRTASGTSPGRSADPRRSKRVSSGTMLGRQKKKRRSRGITITLCVLLVLLLAVVGMILFCRIRTIEVTGSVHYSEDQIRDASGLEYGGSIYQIDKPAIRRRITEQCPYVESVGIRRQLPDCLKITITETPARFYVRIGQECYVIDETLRVLERIPDEMEATYRGLGRVILPPCDYAVVGEHLTFSGDSILQEYITKAISGAMVSTIRARITLFDLRDKYNLYAVSDDLYKLVLGDVSDITVKLNLADKILQDEMFDYAASRAQIDLRDTRECSVTVNNQLTWGD